MSATELTKEGDGGSRPKGSLRIFLNYRREDSSGHAGRLYDDLAEYFSEYEIFIDIDKIEPGLDFGESIDRALDRCDVVLALIGKQWLTLADAKGHRRLDNPDDYVRLELEAALARGTRLIPVRVQGTEMPSSEDLPDSLRALARRHAVELSDTRWRHDVGSLAAVLERLAEENAERQRRAQETEQERLAWEQAERRRLEEEQVAERERLAEETRQRLAQEHAERERLARDEADRKRLAKKQAEQERLAKKQAAERERVALTEAERERLAQGRVEGERRAKERKAERQRVERRGDGAVATTKSTEAEGRPSARVAGWLRRPVTLAAVSIGILSLGAVVAVTLLDGGGDTTAGTQPQQPMNPPMIVSLPTISGTMRAGSTLTARRGSWEHSPTEFTYRWLRCNRNGVSCVAVRGATLPTYRLTNRDVAHRIRASITASNVEGSHAGTSEPTPVVASALIPPKNSSPPTLSGTAQVGQRLSASKGIWRGTKPISPTYLWQRCNALGAGCVVIGGARGTTYTLTSRDVGHTIRVEERASNVAGRRAVRSKATSRVRAERTSTETTTTETTTSETTETVVPPP